MKKRNVLMRYKLQFFAEQQEQQEEQGAQKQDSFDSFLSDPKNQSEFDKRVSKALETARSKFEKEYNAKLEEAKTEAERLAQMTANEKAKYENEKRLSLLEKREKEITARELKAEALATLSSKNMPQELSEILDYTNAEKCQASIENVEKAFIAAVEKAVNSKLRGNGKPSGQTHRASTAYDDLVKNADSMTAQEVAKMWGTLNK